MHEPHPQRPVVLCLGGHDPVGGAGIQADIETVAALGGHAATAITCLTVQDSLDVHALHPVETRIFRAQLDAVLGDMQVDIVKIGLIGDAALVPVIAEALARHPDIPVVFDPVLAAGGGSDLAKAGLITAVIEQLLPMTDLITPNLAEARRLSGQQTADDCATTLIQDGPMCVLLTGTDEVEDTLQVINRLYCDSRRQAHWHWPRLPHSYHGSGCTLASACAVLLAQGLDMHDAVAEAQAFTHQALQSGWRPGHGQHLPWRRPS
jgi:hydroxymethylpyrimidine/phosphomethylpyrimidine kinase